MSVTAAANEAPQPPEQAGWVPPPANHPAPWLYRGPYEVYCPVGHHADEGMRVELTVTD